MANSLAEIIGRTQHDAMTYDVPNFLDAQGRVYRVASFLAEPAWVSNLLAVKAAAGAGLVRPAWDDQVRVDMAGAALAIAALAVGVAPADPSRIQCVIDDDPQAAIAALGLTMIVETI
jgi:hypothetical protein